MLSEWVEAPAGRVPCRARTADELREAPLMDDILQWAQAKAAFSEARQTDKRVPGAAKQELQFGLTQAELTEKLGAFLSRR